MRQHTALSDAEISLEIGSLIRPRRGQSLSYMLGYDRIASARRFAETALGPKFDIRAFHSVVLGKGSRSLDIVSGRRGLGESGESQQGREKLNLFAHPARRRRLSTSSGGS